MSDRLTIPQSFQFCTQKVYKVLVGGWSNKSSMVTKIEYAEEAETNENFELEL